MVNIDIGENIMAFVYKRISTRTMDPLPGKNYATTYNRISPATRRQMIRDLTQVVEELLNENQNNELDIPLVGFPRTGGQTNYSSAQIMYDILDQLDQGKDIPDAMLNRWNKLFKKFPDIQIELTDQDLASNNFGQLFQ